MDIRPPHKDADRARNLLAVAQVDAQETPGKRALPCRDELTDERPYSNDQKIPGN